MKRKERQVEELGSKLAEQERRLAKMEERNRCSRTDEDATAMRTKEDTQGQPKPAYNVQAATQGQLITAFAIYPNPTDTRTLPTFIEEIKENMGGYPSKLVADAGYGSEENYVCMESRGIEAYVKYNQFDRETRPRYKPDPFQGNNFKYDEAEDSFWCPGGRKLRKVEVVRSEDNYGRPREVSRYRAEEACTGCPLRGRCYKGEEDRRTIEVNMRLRRLRGEARERLLTKEGRSLMARRSLEPEAVFGQIKADMGYRRFRHMGKDKVMADFAFLAKAFNIKKLISLIGRGLICGAEGLYTVIIWLIRRPLGSEISLSRFRQKRIA